MPKSIHTERHKKLCELLKVRRKAPGVVYHPEYYGMAPFEHLSGIGEVIAYGINEGRVQATNSP